ncbi:MAG TPA: hypothetical protein VKI61_20055, partial [Chitinophagaceae bacterium]|nr:hypothetical protein [Chitinophagaceae bacterium]
MRNLFLLATILLFSFLLAAQKTIAIKCGKLFDAKSGQTLSNQVIIVKGDIIETVVAVADFKQKTDSVIDL